MLRKSYLLKLKREKERLKREKEIIRISKKIHKDYFTNPKSKEIRV